MARKLSQKETIFYILYRRFKEAPGEYVPVFQVMGEQYVKELGKWGYVSYECSARLSEMFKENPGLFERTTIHGKSGAKYYGYRFAPSASAALILDARLKGFYNSIRTRGHDN